MQIKEALHTHGQGGEEESMSNRPLYLRTRSRHPSKALAHSRTEHSILSIPRS